MIILLETQTTLIIVFSALGAALLVGLALLLNFTVFAHMRAKKQVRELEKRFQHLHGLLVGQDAQNLKRIENISLTNLVYVTIHQNFKKRSDQIRHSYDNTAQGEINHLKDLLGEHDFKALKAEIPNARDIIKRYDAEVNAFDTDLHNVLLPEEECRQASLSMKENLRKIKQDFYVKQADLSLVSRSFDRAFSLLEDNFKSFEKMLECANYDEAKALLPKIGQVIGALSKILRDMPNLCVTIQSVIPDKLASLSDRYEELLKAGYPLHHLLGPSNIQEMRDELDEVTAQVQNFDLSGVQQHLDGIIARIDDYIAAFEREKEARVAFEGEVEGIYAEDSKVENRYIRLCNSLPEVRSIYAIPSSEQEKIDAIKAQINRSGATKRSLDTLMHSGSRQPYTILVERMHALRDESNQAFQAIEDFNRYLLSLKSDSEEAARSIYVYEDRLRTAEYRVRVIDLPCITEKYAQSFEDLYAVIDSIHARLVTPIDVQAINELVNRLKGEGDALCNAVDRDISAMYKADVAILYANRQRMKDSTIGIACEQAYGAYLSGDFSGAYEVAKQAVRASQEQQ